jgi:UDP-N-acetylenolpyruvoylglucosamine reductase
MEDAAVAEGPGPRLLGGVPAREEEPVARHLPLRGVGAFELWVEVPDEAALAAVVRAARAEKLTIRPVPPFCDALPPENGLTGVALRLGRGFEGIREGEGGLWVGASCPLAVLGLRTGFASLAGAPGTLADAWEDGWIAPAIARVRRYRGRSVEEVDATPDAKTLLVEALVKPGVKLQVPPAGRAFREHRRRNLPPLRDLLRTLNLGGVRLGDAALSEEDPTILTNRGEATPRQLRLLLQAARDRVHTATGLELEERLAPPGRGGRL